MGTGKAKAHSKQKHKQLAKLKKRSNNARIIAAHRHNVEKDDTPEATTETGRSKHMAKVIEKQRIKQMLNYKKAERLNIKKKSTDGGEKTQRRALCEEIKLLKEQMAGAEAQKSGSEAPAAQAANMDSDSE